MATTTNARKMFFNQHGWQGLGMLNLVLGLFLCLYAFTDISLAGTIADLLFPPIVLALSILSYRISATISPRRNRRFIRWSCSVGLVVGGSYTLAGAFLFVPPFTLDDEKRAIVWWLLRGVTR